MYAKVFTSIYQGTLRGNAYGILVFTNLLAHCDKTGLVDIHPRAIADEVGVPVDKVREALSFLEAPDTESRTPDEEGRRIVRVDQHRDWGWRVVNYAKYRAIRNEDDRAEQNRLAQARWREKHKVSQSKPASASVSAPSSESAQAEAEADTEANTKTLRAAKPRSSASDAAFDMLWQQYPRHTARKTALQAFQRIGPSAELLDEMLAAVAVQRTTKGWLDGFVPHLGTWLNGKRWEDQPPKQAQQSHETPRQAAARQWAQANSPLAAARAPNDPAPWDVATKEPQRVIT